MDKREEASLLVEAEAKRGQEDERVLRGGIASPKDKLLERGMNRSKDRYIARAQCSRPGQGNKQAAFTEKVRGASLDL